MHESGGVVCVLLINGVFRLVYSIRMVECVSSFGRKVCDE